MSKHKSKEHFLLFQKIPFKHKSYNGIEIKDKCYLFGF